MDGNLDIHHLLARENRC